MPIDITIVRWIHSVAGIIWFGVAFMAVVSLHPFAKNAASDRFMMRWYSQSNMSKIFPIAAIVTTIGGLYVTGRMFVVWNGPWRDAASMNILYVGMVLGLLAFGHGIGLGAQIARYARLSRTVLDAGEPTDEQSAALAKMERSVSRSSIISFALTTAAILSMTLGPNLLPNLLPPT